MRKSEGIPNFPCDVPAKLLRRAIRCSPISGNTESNKQRAGTEEAWIDFDVFRKKLCSPIHVYRNNTSQKLERPMVSSLYAMLAKALHHTTRIHRVADMATLNHSYAIPYSQNNHFTALAPPVTVPRISRTITTMNHTIHIIPRTVHSTIAQPPVRIRRDLRRLLRRMRSM